ncbi:hypothetical protein COCON_G00087490 [Conger conger]|uniref:Uncharacterized protein n=1 Tax=Conger conger TaxID=82655 RepID=A0A9Q1DKL6_CONCO|nr:hypothetical protein COCON_G00087490 [Conger conger]
MEANCAESDTRDYTGVESEATFNRSDDIEERTEWKTLSEMTQEEQDRLSNMKEEVEECEERQNVKTEKEEGVIDAEGLRRDQEKTRDEQKGKGVTDLTCATHIFQKNGVKSEYSQQDKEKVSTLVTACLLNQPRVVICRIKITGNSIPELPHPRPFATKGEQGVTSRQRWQEPSPMKGKCSLRQKDHVMTCKRKIIGQLARPQKHQSASSENGLCLEASHNPTVIAPRNQNRGQTVETSSEVFACSQCPFVHTEEVNLHQHLEKVQPEELRETLVSGRSGAENPFNSRTPQCSKAPETLPIPTQKEDQAVISRQRLQELSPMKGKCSLRQKGQVMTWKRKIIDQLARPHKHQLASSENGLCIETSNNPTDISPRNQNTGQTVKASSEVFSCSQYPLVHTEEERRPGSDISTEMAGALTNEGKVFTESDGPGHDLEEKDDWPAGKTAETPVGFIREWALS